jgi:hypothetical protein
MAAELIWQQIWTAANSAPLFKLQQYQSGVGTQYVSGSFITPDANSVSVVASFRPIEKTYIITVNNVYYVASRQLPDVITFFDILRTDKKIPEPTTEAKMLQALTTRLNQ